MWQFIALCILLLPFLVLKQITKLINSYTISVSSEFHSQTWVLSSIFISVWILVQLHFADISNIWNKNKQVYFYQLSIYTDQNGREKPAVGFIEYPRFVIYLVFCCWQWVLEQKKRIIYPKINVRDEDDVIIKKLK